MQTFTLGLNDFGREGCFDISLAPLKSLPPALCPQTKLLKCLFFRSGKKTFCRPATIFCSSPNYCKKWSAFRARNFSGVGRLITFRFVSDILVAFWSKFPAFPAFLEPSFKKAKNVFKWIFFFKISGIIYMQSIRYFPFWPRFILRVPALFSSFFNPLSFVLCKGKEPV